MNTDIEIGITFDLDLGVICKDITEEAVKMMEKAPIYDNMICHWMNLPKREDRRKKFYDNVLPYVEMLMRCDMIESVDGSKLDLDKMIATGELAGKKYAIYDLTRGQIGCIKSHVKSMEAFLKTDYKYLLNLEDDVVINMNMFEENMDKVLGNLDNMLFDLLYVGRHCCGDRGFYWGKDCGMVYEPKHYGYGAHAYIVTRQAARNIVKYFTDWKGTVRKTQIPAIPFDVWMAHKMGYKKHIGTPIRIYSIKPEGYEEKREEYGNNKEVYSRGSEFIFYAGNHGDSDTTRIK